MVKGHNNALKMQLSNHTWKSIMKCVTFHQVLSEF